MFGFTAIHFAAMKGHQEIVRCLLEAGADKDRADIHGNTPMRSAAMNGNEEILRLLLEAGEDKDRADIQAHAQVYSNGNKESVDKTSSDRVAE